MIYVSKQNRHHVGSCMSCDRNMQVVYVVRQHTKYGNMAIETRYCKKCAADLTTLFRRGGGVAGEEGVAP